LAAVGSRADERATLRYADLSGPLSLVLTQEIGVPDHPGIAGRRFSFARDLGPEGSGHGAPRATCTVSQARGSYTAHGMEQRLSAGHLEGRSFPVVVGDSGQVALAEDPTASPAVAVGAPVARSMPIGEALSEVLPVLPAEPVAVGSEWTTETELHALEGWSWGVGSLRTTHHVSAVDRRAGDTVVSVASSGRADLGPMEGDANGYRGTLRRSSEWTFDASSGRLLSLTIEQKTEGVSPMARGDVQVSQSTRIELSWREHVAVPVRP